MLRANVGLWHDRRKNFPTQADKVAVATRIDHVWPGGPWTVNEKALVESWRAKAPPWPTPTLTAAANMYLSSYGWESSAPVPPPSLPRPRLLILTMPTRNPSLMTGMGGEWGSRRRRATPLFVALICSLMVSGLRMRQSCSRRGWWPHGWWEVAPNGSTSSLLGNHLHVFWTFTASSNLTTRSSDWSTCSHHNKVQTRERRVMDVSVDWSQFFWSTMHWLY